jgi:tRNA (guanine26-N2/guanine27-N2)-dimethyltransferase
LVIFLYKQKNNGVKHAPAIGPVVPQECSDCGKKFNVGGPIWSAPIHDQDWVLSTLTGVKSMKDRYPAYDKITSVLNTMSEVPLPPPPKHTHQLVEERCCRF